MRTETNFYFHFMPHSFISPPATGCSIEIVQYRPYGIAWQLYDAKGLYCQPFVLEKIQHLIMLRILTLCRTSCHSSCDY